MRSNILSKNPIPKNNTKNNNIEMRRIGKKLNDMRFTSNTHYS